MLLTSTVHVVPSETFTFLLCDLVDILDQVVRWLAKSHDQLRRVKTGQKQVRGIEKGRLHHKILRPRHFLTVKTMTDKTENTHNVNTNWQRWPSPLAVLYQFFYGIPRSKWLCFGIKYTESVQNECCEQKKLSCMDSFVCSSSFYLRNISKDFLQDQYFHILVFFIGSQNFFSQNRLAL